jgi:hypothetical protein
MVVVTAASGPICAVARQNGGDLGLVGDARSIHDRASGETEGVSPSRRASIIVDARVGGVGWVTARELAHRVLDRVFGAFHRSVYF